MLFSTRLRVKSQDLSHLHVHSFVSTLCNPRDLVFIYQVRTAAADADTEETIDK
jgi:hypothetical protein